MLPARRPLYIQDIYHSIIYGSEVKQGEKTAESAGPISRFYFATAFFAVNFGLTNGQEISSI